MNGFYEAPDMTLWTGRVDNPEDPHSFRWHQVVKPLNLKDDSLPLMDSSLLNICFIGFCCDAGVEMNLGRIGASKGPSAIRSQMCNLPFNFSEDMVLYDGGNVICEFTSQLSEAQNALSEKVAFIIQKGMFPVVLGGGHEVAYGNYHGIRRSVVSRGRTPNIGIINFDAHFDMRPYDKGANSGTMFRQISDECSASEEPFNYMVMGIQKYGNTKSLFDQADRLGVKYITGDNIKETEILEVLNKVHSFVRGRKNLHLTICTDVFSSAFAPGVSAPQPFGIDPKVSLGILRNILKSGKVTSIDVAEVSPRFDDDNITSKLVSILIFEMLSSLVKVFKDEI